MRNTFIISIILIVVVIFVACGNDVDDEVSSSDDGGSSGEVYEMDVNVTFPSTHYITEQAFEPLKEYIEDITDGQVEVNIHSGEALGKITSVYQDVTSGLYDMSLLIIPYYEDTEFFPLTIGNLPFAVEGPREARIVLSKFAEKYVETKDDYYVLGEPMSSYSYDLFSTKPLEGIDDLKNMNLRSSGKADTMVIKEIGATPVSFSLTEVYEALEKHTIDATFNDPTGGVSSKFYEPANNITRLDFQVMPGIALMNKGFYDGLPDDLQEMFDGEISDKTTEFFVDAYENAGVEADEYLEENATVNTWSDEEYERFKEASKVAWDAWIEQANKQGYDGQAMVDDFLEILEEEGLAAPY